ncbi:acetate kinase [Synechococcus sp. PCC 7502]|uniref:acetate/propionate family kinase n=1 Tax=Synechococcus sp. PCC 7502 TaxID=1173263 RepID=UPI00029FCF0E|nr:acetate kinase [Synechococcus sp. PCC 7502]AFY75209.1 acetate kinase [Synechococcus sp. PCC 7502]
MKILILNSGSSSQKSCLYEITEMLPHPITPVWEAQIDWTHQQGKAELKVKTKGGETQQQSWVSTSRLNDTIAMLETLWQGVHQVIDSPRDISVVGHRVVHGGQDYQNSVVITSEVKAAIARLASFAPIHNPINLEGITAIEQIFGDVSQVAVFDTAFHSHLPPPAYIYSGDYNWTKQGIRRYGFHGISHEYCVNRAAQILDRNLKDLRLINCHLGNGCSLAAVKVGKSFDTTMGFTPLEGLMMGTRSGSIDPGILIYLLRAGNYNLDQLEQLLNKGSGLLGISGISGDMRQIIEAIAQGNERAKLAMDIYIHRLRSAIGAMLASLEGLDVLIFTAGVGENSPLIREATCKAFAFLGLEIDLEKNLRSPVDQDISTPESTVRVLVIHTQEDWEIARECWNLLA